MDVNQQYQIFCDIEVQNLNTKLTLKQKIPLKIQIYNYLLYLHFSVHINNKPTQCNKGNT